MSNFSYKDAKGKLTQIPVRFGDMNRQVAQVMNKNSENIIQSAPFIACYIKNMEFARDRLSDPTFVSKVNIRERAFDENGQEYLNTQGANYTVERLMPTPFNLQFSADIWTTNIDQKLQILEQMLVLFRPAIEIQTNNNYVDWTSLSLVELTGMTFSSRSIPQGMEQDIDIANLSFTTPIWLTTPAKVKKLGVITKIITSVFEEPAGTIAGGAYSAEGMDYFTGRTPIIVDVTTVGNFSLLVLDNTAKIIPNASGVSEHDLDPALVNTQPKPVQLSSDTNWRSLLDLYPGKFTAGLSQLRLAKPDGNEIVGHISLDPNDDAVMHINFDTDTIPMDTLITDLDSLNPRGTIDAIINPETFNPRPYNSNGDLGWAAIDARFLILEDINSRSAVGAESWKNQDGSNFTAHANDIVQWDGIQWNIVLDSANTRTLTYITNSRTGVQYAWDGENWMKSFEGTYDAGNWRLVL